MENRMGIVILNYNTWSESIKCIDSILKFTKGEYKIYLVDNKSTDNSAVKLQNYYRYNSKVIYIQANDNRGYSAGNNIGIKKAIIEGCNTIFVINSDVELLNDALDKMNTTLTSNSEYVAIGPSVINNNQVESQLPRKKLTWKLFLYERHPLCLIPYFKKRANRKYNLKESGKLIFQGMVAGCCFGMRAADFNKVGLLDENVFLYYEEDILAYKIEKLNKKAIVDFDAKVWHKENVSTNKKGSAFVRFHRWSSVLYLLKTYARIGKIEQYILFWWNIVTWMLLSVIDKNYRKYLKAFVLKNCSIIKG